MSNQVYANTMEVSCKAAGGKTICAFPDVCFTPPQTPATPPGVPIPYPNTGLASDTSDGSSSVQVSGQEVMLKNKSSFKKSSGDEAGSAPQKGVMTGKTGGKVFFIGWSMDVLIEGENCVRMMDMTTHNHGSQPNTPPMAYFDEVAVELPEACRKDAHEANKACAGATKRPQRKTKGGNLVDDGLDCSDDCKKKQKCILVPKGKDKQACCSPDTTGHHLIEDHWVKGNQDFSWYRSNRKGSGFQRQSISLTDAERDAGVRTVDDAPCVCGNRKRSEQDHEEMHSVQGVIEEAYLPGGDLHEPGHPSFGFTYEAGKKAALNAHDATYSSENPEQQCDRDCLEAQLDAFYQADPETPLNRPTRRQPIGEEARTVTSGNWSGSIKGRQ